MKFHLSKRVIAAAISASLTVAAGSAAASVAVIYEDLPTNTSMVESFHNATGPVLADDFMPARSGTITRAEWWGSAPTSTQWEIALHTNSPINHPNIDDPVQGALVKYEVTATGTPVADEPGLFHFAADLLGPAPMTVQANATYWFTVANFAPDWLWADALDGATVGEEAFNSHRSTNELFLCADGGPHCGPWTDVHTDLAFRLIAQVPEPGTLALLGLAGLGLAVSRRRRV